MVISTNYVFFHWLRMEAACSQVGAKFTIGGEPSCDKTVSDFNTLRGKMRSDISHTKWFVAYIYLNTVAELASIKNSFWSLLELDGIQSEIECQEFVNDLAPMRTAQSYFS